MFQKVKFILLWACLTVAAAASLKAALPFLFWLPNPGRTNTNDPKSDLFKPTVASAPAATKTTSPTPTATPSISPSPTYSNTANGTFTDSPTPSASPTVTETFTPLPTPTCGAMYDTFEGSWTDQVDCGGYGANTWCPFYPGDANCIYCVPDTSVLDIGKRSSVEHHSGSYSWYITGSSNSGDSCGWGQVYFGLNHSSIYPGAADVAAGLSCAATKFVMWVKTDQDISVNAYIPETISAPSDGEEWVTSTPISVAASGSWQKVTVPFSSLTDEGWDDDSDNSTPRVPGDGVLELNALGGIWFYFTADTPGCPSCATIHTYIDDMGFEP
jgi:hypothetical protein